jgi:hypothetical protein
MTDNYAEIVQENLNRLYGNLPKDLAKNLPGEQDEERFIFDAFGEKCVIQPHGITLGEVEHSSVKTCWQKVILRIQYVDWSKRY